MGSFRLSLRLQRISSKASKLMSKSRRPGTISNYELSWIKFVRRSGQNLIDPFCCSIENVVSFLAELFDSGFQFHAICSSRSGISTFHQKIHGCQQESNHLFHV